MGRISEPWTNLEPPIRSPDYYINLKARKDADKEHAAGLEKPSKRARSVDLGSAAALLTTKLSTTATCTTPTCTRRPTAIVSPDPEKQPLVSESKAAFDQKAHRDQYALEMEHNERTKGLLENPSVDAETQRAIVREYRELHQRFKDEGLYQCRYSAYAWESLRCGTLFAIFMGFLLAKWYLTSSVFLGVFWVRLPRQSPANL